MEHIETNFRTVRDAAARWGITSRMVRNYARAGRIEGAVLIKNWQGQVWLIPKGAKKPERKA